MIILKKNGIKEKLKYDLSYFLYIKRLIFGRNIKKQKKLNNNLIFLIKKIFEIILFLCIEAYFCFY
jgi:hypothetical protein